MFGLAGKVRAGTTSSPQRAPLMGTWLDSSALNGWSWCSPSTDSAQSPVPRAPDMVRAKPAALTV